MKTLKVLVVADVSAAHIHGGAERMLHHHIRALLQAGMQVTVLTRQAEPEQPLQVTLPSGVVEHRLPFSGNRGWRGLRELRQAARRWWLSTHDFDCVLAEQPFTMWALMQAGCRLPRLQVCHSFAFEEYATRYGLDGHWKHRLVTAAMRRLEARVYDSASAALVLSEFMAARLRDFFAMPPASIHVAAGGIERAEALARRDDLRKQLWGDDAERPQMVTLRNLVPRTGVDLMIQVAAIVRVERPDVRWTIIGDGEFKKALQGLSDTLGMQDVIHFAGFVDEEKVQTYLHAADVFILPTRSLEGFGLVTLEANVQGLPVMATPSGANPAVVGWHPLNRVAQDMTPDALAQEVLRYLHAMPDDKQRQQLAEQTAEHFAWKKHDQALVEALHQVCT